MKKNIPVIIDTNIILSSLLTKNSTFFESFQSARQQFYICELSLIELFNHKEKILRYSKLSEDEISKTYYYLLKKLTIFKEDLIEKTTWKKAYDLCKDIDETDTPFVALTIELDGLLFTGDQKLKKHLRAKGFDAFYEYSQKRTKK